MVWMVLVVGFVAGVGVVMVDGSVQLAIAAENASLLAIAAVVVTSN